MPIVAYDNSILWTKEKWHPWVDNMIGAGLKVFHISLLHAAGTYGQSRFWTDEGVYPSPPASGGPNDLTLEYQVAYILKRVPDARFVVRLRSYAPTAWVKKNPGEMQTSSDGKIYQPSWASQKYLNGMRGHYMNVVGWVEKQAWSERVLGYFIMPYGEGLTLLSIHGHFYDHSAAMKAAWRQWLHDKYPSDAALQSAWNDNSVQRADAPMLSDAELKAKTEALPFWPDPKSMQRERDYALLQRAIFERYVRTLTQAVKDAAPRRVIVGLDAMKQPLLGWQINEAFFGTGRNTDEFSMYVASGSFDVGKLLDLPSLDCLVTPADYTARGVGWGFEGEGLSDSLVLRGKTLFVENDSRTWLAQETEPDRKSPLGSFMTPAEVRAGLLRNSAQVLSRGLQFYWTDINAATSYFTTPVIQREVARNRDLMTRSTIWPHHETEHAVAMIIDDQSLIYTNYTTGYEQLAVLRQRVEGLALMGIPYRVYLLSDLKKENFPAYRCYLFPNLYEVDDETLALLKRKVLRDGRIAIFGPGTGITDGKTISAAGAEHLLGIPMKLHQGTSSRRVRFRSNSRLWGKQTIPPLYGDSLAYGPILAPDRERLRNEKVLGDLVASWQVNAPGLVLKEFGRGASGSGQPGARGTDDYAVVFAASVPLPSPLLRALARYGGCNVWVNDDVVVSASETMVSIHANVSGKQTIHFPWNVSTLRNAVTDKVVARNVRQYSVDLNAPETRIFRVERGP